MAGSSLGVMDKWILTLAINVKTWASANQSPALGHVTKYLGQVTLREFCVIFQPEVSFSFNDNIGFLLFCKRISLDVSNSSPFCIGIDDIFEI